MKEPKDLGVTIGTKREVIFTEGRQSALGQVEGLEKSIMFNREIIKMCDRVIEEEKKKFK